MLFSKHSFIFLITLFLQSLCVAESIPKISSTKVTPIEVIFETTMGSFVLELYPEKAPKTVTNFLSYVDQKYYENTLFHRVIPRFMAQGGGFEKGMKKKETNPPVKNESDNNLKNIRGTISMARTKHPDSATSQFFINVVHNPGLDYKNNKPGYTVFGKVAKGMNVVDKIIAVPTKTSEPYSNVPKTDVLIISAKRSVPLLAKDKTNRVDTLDNQTQFIEGKHYVVLEKPLVTRDSSKIEVVAIFSYGCPHCYQLELLLQQWNREQQNNIDFWQLPAIWNTVMNLYAKAFYSAQELDIIDKMHPLLFNAIVIEQKKLESENELVDFFAQQDITKKTFLEVFKSAEIAKKIKHAETYVGNYKPASVPEIIVNGKYRIDRMRANGLKEMISVLNFLINKEHSMLK